MRQKLPEGDWKAEFEKNYTFHALANLFPMMDEAETLSLSEDIKENGLQEPIILVGNEILDGRNRFQACLIAGVRPKFQNFESVENASCEFHEPSEEHLRNFVFAKNLHRRHLSKDQKEEMAIQLRKADWSQDAIAKALRVSIGTVNKWVKDIFNNENTGTRTDKAGRQRPASYNKKSGGNNEPDEQTEEEKIETAKIALEEWIDTQKEAGVPFLMLQDIARDILELK